MQSVRLSRPLVQLSIDFPPRIHPRDFVEPRAGNDYRRVVLPCFSLAPKDKDKAQCLRSAATAIAAIRSIAPASMVPAASPICGADTTTFAPSTRNSRVNLSVASRSRFSNAAQTAAPLATAINAKRKPSPARIQQSPKNSPKHRFLMCAVVKAPVGGVIRRAARVQDPTALPFSAKAGFPPWPPAAVTPEPQEAG